MWLIRCNVTIVDLVWCQDRSKWFAWRKRNYPEMKFRKRIHKFAYFEYTFKCFERWQKSAATLSVFGAIRPANWRLDWNDLFIINHFITNKLKQSRHHIAFSKLWKHKHGDKTFIRQTFVSQTNTSKLMCATTTFQTPPKQHYCKCFDQTIQNVQENWWSMTCKLL